MPIPAASEQVAFGPAGVVHGTAIRHYVELSTIGAKSIRRIAETLAERGIGVLDAPVNGRPRAPGGQLTCLVSASRPDFASAQAALNALANRLYHVSEVPGRSQVLKLANNMLCASNFTLASEMVQMAIKAGVDRDVAIEVINASSGRSKVTEDHVAQQIFSQAYGVGARFDIMRKDLVLGDAEAGELGISHEAASAILRIWDAAIASGRGPQDISHIYDFVQERSLAAPPGA